MLPSTDNRISLANKVIRRVGFWMIFLTLVLCVFPVEYRSTRLLLLLCLAGSWMGGLWFWWGNKIFRASFLVLPIVLLCYVSLPGRAINPVDLAQQYVRCLRSFRGVTYVWGGEGLLGIDCSGLVRKGMIYAQLWHGLQTLNGRSVREALILWWHDCSAKELRDGYQGFTQELFRADSIQGADHGQLRAGDLAVTEDGIHIMAYLGNRTWIEADPSAHQVLEVSLPTLNSWFNQPILFLRWRWLNENQTPRQGHAVEPRRL